VQPRPWVRIPPPRLRASRTAWLGRKCRVAGSSAQLLIRVAGHAIWGHPRPQDDRPACRPHSRGKGPVRRLASVGRFGSIARATSGSHRETSEARPRQARPSPPLRAPSASRPRAAAVAVAVERSAARDCSPDRQPDRPLLRRRKRRRQRHVGGRRRQVAGTGRAHEPRSSYRRSAARDRDTPHSRQNFAWSGFCTPQAAHAFTRDSTATCRARTNRPAPKLAHEPDGISIVNVWGRRLPAMRPAVIRHAIRPPACCDHLLASRRRHPPTRLEG
jgi:hypothetical protein